MRVAAEPARLVVARESEEDKRGPCASSASSNPVCLRRSARNSSAKSALNRITTRSGDADVTGCSTTGSSEAAMLVASR